MNSANPSPLCEDAQALAPVIAVICTDALSAQPTVASAAPPANRLLLFVPILGLGLAALGIPALVAFIVGLFARVAAGRRQPAGA